MSEEATLTFEYELNPPDEDAQIYLVLYDENWLAWQQSRDIYILINPYTENFDAGVPADWLFGGNWEIDSETVGPDEESGSVIAGGLSPDSVSILSITKHFLTNNGGQFWWRLDSSDANDYLVFKIGGSEVTRLEGGENSPWTSFDYSISGEDTLELSWELHRDAASTDANLKGYVDVVGFPSTRGTESTEEDFITNGGNGDYNLVASFAESFVGQGKYKVTVTVNSMEPQNLKWSFYKQTADWNGVPDTSINDQRLAIGAGYYDGTQLGEVITSGGVSQEDLQAGVLASLVATIEGEPESNSILEYLQKIKAASHTN